MCVWVCVCVCTHVQELSPYWRQSVSLFLPHNTGENMRIISTELAWEGRAVAWVDRICKEYTWGIHWLSERERRTGVCELHFLMSSESLKLDETFNAQARKRRHWKRAAAPTLEPHPITGCNPQLGSLQKGAKGSGKSREWQESLGSEGTLVSFGKLGGGTQSGCLSTRAEVFYLFVWLYTCLLRQDLLDTRQASSSLWS